MRTVEFFFGLALALFELVVSILRLLSQVLVKVGYFLVLLVELGVGVFGESIDVVLKVFSGLLNFKVEFVLEGEESIVGAFGLASNVLLAAFDFPEWAGGYLSMSWKWASSCFFHSSLFFFMYSKSSPICTNCFLSSYERCLSCSIVDFSLIDLKVIL